MLNVITGYRLVCVGVIGCVCVCLFLLSYYLFVCVQSKGLQECMQAAK